MALRRQSNAAKRLAQEAFHLTQQIYRHRPTTILETRQILQQNLNVSVGNYNTNSLASTLLKVDKEIVYMKYEGFPEYFTKRIREGMLKRSMFQNLLTQGTGNRRSSASTSSIKSNSSSSEVTSATANANASSDRKKAKIAFMITKQQKQTLAQRLNYVPEIIKTLKPTEALLILENDLKAYDYSVVAATGNDAGVDEAKEWRNKLDTLVEENEALLRQQEEEHEAEELESQKKQQEESRNIKMSNIPAEADSDTKTYMYEVIEVTTPSTITSLSTSTSTALVLSTEITSPRQSESTLPSTTSKAAEPPSTTTSTTPEIVLALCKTEEEAQEFIDIKLDLMNKRKNSKEMKKESSPASGVQSQNDGTTASHTSYKIQIRVM